MRRDRPLRRRQAPRAIMIVQRMQRLDVDDRRPPRAILGRQHRHADRKSTRLNSSTNAHTVCRLPLEKQHYPQAPHPPPTPPPPPPTQTPPPHPTRTTPPPPPTATPVPPPPQHTTRTSLP